MEQVNVRFLANSGVYVQYRDCRFLVDGIYGKNRFFTPPLKEIQKAVFGMNSPYRDVDYILHTHRHTDHFNAGYVDEYAVNNAVKRIFVPQSSPDPESFLEDRAPLQKAAERGLLQEISLRQGQRESWQLAEDCSVTFCCCRHLDWKSYPSVMHCAVLLTLGNKRLLFAADANTSEENENIFRNLGPLTAMFVTPLFYVHPDGRHMLERLAPEHAILYHIPFAEDDTTGLRALVEKELTAYGQGAVTVDALMEPAQTMIL